MELIYVINTTSTAVAAGAAIPTTLISHHRKTCVRAFDDSAIPTIRIPGYYHVTGFVTFTSAAGTASVSVAKNGVAEAGTTASLTAEASTVYTLPISASILVKCGEPPVIVSVVNGATAITVTNIALTVAKVA